MWAFEPVSVCMCLCVRMRVNVCMWVCVCESESSGSSHSKSVPHFVPVTLEVRLRSPLQERKPTEGSPLS